MSEHSGITSRPLLYLAEFTLAGLAAGLSYVLLERPVLRWKSRFRGAQPELTPVHVEPVAGQLNTAAT